MKTNLWSDIWAELGTWGFLIFFTIKKMIFCIFVKLIWFEVDFQNRTGAEIGYQLDKKFENIIFIVEKTEKIPKVPSSVYDKT